MVVFWLVLGGLAWVGERGRAWPTGLLWLFMMGDYVTLALLPRFGRSYGPPQPATLLLGLPRVAVALLPLPIVATLSIEALGSGLAYYGAWVEPRRLHLTRQRLTSSKLAAGPQLEVFHFGDLHIERLTERDRSVVDQVASLAPDLVLFSGDLLSTTYVRDPEAWKACRWVFERLSAPLGVYVVSGTGMSDPEDVVGGILDGLPVRWLRDQKVTLEHAGQPIDLIGITCTHRPFEDRKPLERLISPGRFTILLHHTPDLAPDAAELGVDLMLSGHTHGGQVRLPGLGAVFTSTLYGKAFEMGRYQQDRMTLYVTRGVGLEGSGVPRVRFLCRPESVVWEIDGAPQGPESGVPLAR